MTPAPPFLWQRHPFCGPCSCYMCLIHIFVGINYAMPDDSHAKYNDITSTYTYTYIYCVCICDMHICEYVRNVCRTGRLSDGCTCFAACLFVIKIHSVATILSVTLSFRQPVNQPSHLRLHVIANVCVCVRTCLFVWESVSICIIWWMCGSIAVAHIMGQRIRNSSRSKMRHFDTLQQITTIWHLWFFLFLLLKYIRMYTTALAHVQSSIYYIHMYVNTKNISKFLSLSFRIHFNRLSFVFNGCTTYEWIYVLSLLCLDSTHDFYYEIIWHCFTEQLTDAYVLTYLCMCIVCVRICCRHTIV